MLPFHHHLGLMAGAVSSLVRLAHGGGAVGMEETDFVDRCALDTQV